MALLMFQGGNWDRLIAGWPERPSMWFDEWKKTLVDVHAALIDHAETVKVIRQNESLTEKGMADAVAEMVMRLIKPRLVAMHKALAEMDEREAAIRGQIVRSASPQAATPSEVALRSDVRAHVRAMSESQRMAFVAENTDPFTVAALLEGPAYLSGVTEAQRNALTESLLTEEQRGILADIELAREIVEPALRGAVAVADNALEHAARPLLAPTLLRSEPDRRVYPPEAAGSVRAA